jgi:predicted AlkP superfamily pyrophosphatase or phosphodiesterase
VQITNSIRETHGFKLEAPARRHAFALTTANFMGQIRRESIFEYFTPAICMITNSKIA